MAKISGFSPIVEKSATMLILGSMPSVASLQQQQYYGHSRNAFWPTMLAIFAQVDSNTTMDYEQRKQLLMDNKIAVWDVLQSCSRAGSLDSAIAMKSIQTNDFNLFFSHYNKINTVLFNGTKAENIYKKNVLPGLDSQFSKLQYYKLPSTSPAYAAINLQQKIEIWSKHIKR